MDGSGVRFPAGERSLAGKAKVAQELPSNPSSGANREKPERESVHGDAGIRKLYQNTKQMILAERRFDSALRAKFITDCLTF